MTSSTSDVHRPLLTRLRSTTEVSEAAEAAIRSLPVRPLEYEPKTDLITEDARLGYSFFLIEGTAASYKIEENGSRQISSFHQPGDMPDLYTLQLGRADSSITALRHTVIGTVQHSDLRALCHSNSEVCDILWRQTLIEGSIAREWVSNVGRRDALSRVAHIFCEVAARSAAVGIGTLAECPFPITQADLADATGLTAVHLNRTVQELRQAGLIQLTRRDLSILEWDRLADAGGFNPNYLFLREPPP